MFVCFNKTMLNSWFENWCQFCLCNASMYEIPHLCIKWNDYGEKEPTLLIAAPMSSQPCLLSAPSSSSVARPGPVECSLPLIRSSLSVTVTLACLRLRVLAEGKTWPPRTRGLSTEDWKVARHPACVNEKYPRPPRSPGSLHQVECSAPVTHSIAEGY